MNRLLTISLVIAGLLLFAESSNAQSKQKKDTRESKHEELGEHIGSMVEEVIDRIAKNLNPSRHEDEKFFASDTLRKRRSRRVPSSVKIDIDDKSITYEGDAVIKKDDVITSNVVVKAGDLTVFGKIEGDVLVVGGDIYVREGGRITGNAKVINGDVVRDEGGTIDGYIDQTSSRAESYREEEKKFTRSSTRLNANWVSETTNLDNFIFRYNRVEGIFLGLGSEKRYYWDGRKDYSVHGSVGWGFKSHRWRYNLGIARQFTLYNSDEKSSELLEVGVEGHSLTDSKDQWIIGTHENTAAAFFIHEDYRDYFGREGLTIHTGYFTQQDYVAAQAKIEYNLDKYISLTNKTDWALFGGDKRFRENPLINDGSMRSVLASIGYSTVTKTMHGPEGWSLYTTAEYAGRSLGGEFDFSQYVLDVRRYQPLGRYDNINARLRFGTSNGDVPLQKTFEIGGLSTLNGFPFKSDAGNRMILLNAEYIINGDFLGDLTFWPSWFMSGINFIVLSDAGLVRTASSDASWTEGFGGMKFSEFKHDIGVGIGSRSGSFRLALVWRTDRSEEPRFIFRFARPF